MEVLARYGSPAQQAHWLLPLLRGDIRSCFAMTEKAVASSDATNVQSSVVRSGGEYVLNGLKCWISGACDPACAVAIFMAKNDPTAAPHKQQCMVLVPMAARGVRVLRPMTVYGNPDAPHGHAEMELCDVRCAARSWLMSGLSCARPEWLDVVRALRRWMLWRHAEMELCDVRCAARFWLISGRFWLISGSSCARRIVGC